MYSNLITYYSIVGVVAFLYCSDSTVEYRWAGVWYLLLAVIYSTADSLDLLHVQIQIEMN